MMDITPPDTPDQSDHANSTLQLAVEVYRLLREQTESFEMDDIGADGLYLVGAILMGEQCEWPQGRPILKLLRAHLPAGHPVFRYIAEPFPPAHPIVLPCFGIVVKLNGGGGTISSELHGGKSVAGDERDHDIAMHALEALILAHACAGIDIIAPAYLEGIETAVQACENNLSP
ncbi:MAG: hypothetical protein ABSH20_03720 [Tepidisphaeraceae bacterium]|jgi:hypothetical protein